MALVRGSKHTPGEPDAQIEPGETGRFELRLQQATLGFIWRYFWRIAAFGSGCVVGYVSISWQLHDLRESTKQLKTTVDKLITRDALKAELAPRDIEIGQLKQWQVDHTALPNNKEAADALALAPHRKRTK